MNRSATLGAEECTVRIGLDESVLDGVLSVPENAVGLAIFIHESGSNRRNPTNRYIARKLNEAGVATLLFDLLTSRESEIDKISRHLRFDVDLMARRARGVTEWAAQQMNLVGLQVGCFGCGRGAASALIAAARGPGLIKTVISLGGRVDLARAALPQVQAPTLLIVGRVKSILKINECALRDLPPGMEKKLEIFKEVSYSWDEPDTLERLSTLVNAWFRYYLALLPPDIYQASSQDSALLRS